jgi:hypothetical protein
MGSFGILVHCGLDAVSGVGFYQDLCAITYVSSSFPLRLFPPCAPPHPRGVCGMKKSNHEARVSVSSLDVPHSFGAAQEDFVPRDIGNPGSCCYLFAFGTYLPGFQSHFP